MSDKNPPLTDYQKTVYDSGEQELLKLGTHIVHPGADEVETVISLIQTIRHIMGEPPLTEEELTLIIEQAKNNS